MAAAPHPCQPASSLLPETEAIMVIINFYGTHALCARHHCKHFMSIAPPDMYANPRGRASGTLMGWMWADLESWAVGLTIGALPQSFTLAHFLPPSPQNVSWESTQVKGGPRDPL